MKKKIIATIMCLTLLFAFSTFTHNPNNGIQTLCLFDIEELN